MFELDTICISILEILAENEGGIGISMLDRKLYDRLGYDFAISLNFRTGDKIRELKQLELISQISPYKLTIKGKLYLDCR